MARGNLPHLIVHGTERPEDFSKRGRGPQLKLPPRDRTKHAAHLLGQLRQAEREATARKQSSPVAVVGAAEGMYLHFESEPGHGLKLRSLEDKTAGIELVAVPLAEEGKPAREIATVYVPKGKLSAFIKKVEAYRDEHTGQDDPDKRKPKNKPLVESIAEIQLAALRSFWTDEASLYPDTAERVAWEVWLRRTPQLESQLEKLMALEGVSVRPGKVDFQEVSVIIAFASAQSLAVAPDVLDGLAELRLARSAAVFLDRKEAYRGAVDALATTLRSPPADAPAICLLDTGVERAHRLLSPFLAEGDAHLYHPTWPGGDDDGHGTEMAGVALYENLRVALAEPSRLEIRYRLESVKAVNPHAPHDPANYGAVTQECVYRVEEAAPARNRIICLTIASEDGRDRGLPSSWSAAIDDLCAGTEDDTPRLMVVCAGNIHDIAKHDQYPDSNMAESIHDPGQAWNALTIGAHTELVALHGKSFSGWRPIAERGALSPISSTSRTWDPAWPLKPELVLEGGNSARDGAGGVESPESLSVLSTRPRLRGSYGATGDTSAATAACARLGAMVMAEYPDLWPETVRALLVDSAEWTDAMRDAVPSNPKRRDREDALRMFGYGVPDLERARSSAANDLTLIVQSSIQPFDAKGRMNEMHVHELPWPTEVLEALGEAEVELRVTLSYFVEASPARRGWDTRHRYASHGLRFDVQTPTETVDELRARLNDKAKADDIDKTKSDSKEWWLGPTVRDKGSLHHDRWTGTAAELAKRSHLAVFPVLGWWRERRLLGRAERRARYALVVRIRTDETEVDLYSSVRAKVAPTTVTQSISSE